ncbi:hypothetical protein BDC45DRAFT_531884 [Circinella umbellata]|nr:hypothetical protein BDC45DRAFT_531884 [Circinella umbellata]
MYQAFEKTMQTSATVNVRLQPYSMKTASHSPTTNLPATPQYHLSYKKYNNRLTIGNKDSTSDSQCKIDKYHGLSVNKCCLGELRCEECNGTFRPASRKSVIESRG